MVLVKVIFNILVDNKLTNSQTAPFRKVKGYNLKKINDYIEKYKDSKRLQLRSQYC